jgi:hypothetical protein
MSAPLTKLIGQGLAPALTRTRTSESLTDIVWFKDEAFDQMVVKYKAFACGRAVNEEMMN